MKYGLANSCFHVMCNALHDSCWSWEWLGVLAGEVMDMVESAFYDHVGVVQKGWNMFQPPVSTESTAVHAAFCIVGVSMSLPWRMEGGVLALSMLGLLAWSRVS